MNMAPSPLLECAVWWWRQAINRLENSSGSLKKSNERGKSFLSEQGSVAVFSLGMFADSEEVRKIKLGISRGALLG